MTRRVLILKFGAIGDVIMAIPAAYALHQQGMEIDWVCGQTIAPLFVCYPWIRTIIADDRALVMGGKLSRLKAMVALWNSLPSRRYDVCATLYYDPRYRLLSLPVRAGRRVQLSTASRETTLLPGRHHTDEYARILLGLKDDVRTTSLAPIRPQSLPASPLPRTAGTRIVLAPAGARNMMRDDALRRWPVESYAALARQLLERGMDVVLIGGPDDLWAMPFFAEMKVANCIGKLSLLETLAVLDDSDVLVTHDTGPLHLGGITRAGIVCLFGPTDPRGRIPQRPDVVAIWGGEGFACRPCYDGRNFAPCHENGCMRQIDVAIVIKEVETMIEQRRNRSRPPRIISPASTVSTENWP